MKTKEDFGGEYVVAMDTLPLTRFRWLLPKLGLRRTDAVVDYACGSGRLLDCIHDQIASYHGVDFSQEFVTYAQERVKRLGISNAVFECGEITDFCARHGEAFDAAFTIDFAGYLDDATFVRIYSAIRRSLKNDGRLYMYMANGRYIVEMLKRRGLLPASKGAYRSVRTQEEYERLLKLAGFERIEVTFTPHFNRLRLLHFLSHAPVVGPYGQAKILVTCQK